MRNKQLTLYKGRSNPLYQNTVKYVHLYKRFIFNNHAIFICKHFTINFFKSIKTIQYAFFYAFRTNSSNLETRIEEDRTNQNRRFDSDLQNVDFNADLPPRHPLFKYNDNHILVGYSRSFWSGFMSTRYPFT